jgi:hypothetical protein
LQPAIIEYSVLRILVALEKINKSKYESSGKIAAPLPLCYWVLICCL